MEMLGFASYSMDFIFSVRGGFVYTLNSFRSLENALNSLKVHGIAFLEDATLLLSKEWIVDFLTQRGFSADVARYENGGPASLKIIRDNLEPIDLSRFEKRYLLQIEANKEVFLRWGFDRMKKDTPLDEVFSGLYSKKHYQDLLEE